MYRDWVNVLKRPEKGSKWHLKTSDRMTTNNEKWTCSSSRWLEVGIYNNFVTRSWWHRPPYDPGLGFKRSTYVDVLEGKTEQLQSRLQSRRKWGSEHERVRLLQRYTYTFSENKEANRVFVCSTVLVLSWWTFEEITVSLPMLGLFHGQLMWFAFICGQSHSKKVVDSTLLRRNKKGNVTCT